MNFHAYERENMLAEYLHNKTIQNYSMAQKEDLINCVHSFLSQKNSQMLYHMIGITQINEH